MVNYFPGCIFERKDSFGIAFNPKFNPWDKTSLCHYNMVSIVNGFAFQANSKYYVFVILLRE